MLLCWMVHLEPAGSKLAPEFSQVHISLPPVLTCPKTGNNRHAFVGGSPVFIQSPMFPMGPKIKLGSIYGSSSLLILGYDHFPSKSFRMYAPFMPSL